MGENPRLQEDTDDYGEDFIVISDQYGTLINCYGSTDEAEVLWPIPMFINNDIIEDTTISGTMFDTVGGNFY